MARPDEVVSGFHACCDALMRGDPAGGEALVAFRGEGRALEWSRLVLEISPRADAQFQAVAALRDVGLQRWAAVDRVGLRDYLWGVCQEAREKVVVKAALGAHALAWKRGSLEGWRCEDAVERCASSSEVGVEALRSLVGAFAAETGLGVTKGAHGEARRRWEREGLVAAGRLAFGALKARRGHHHQHRGLAGLCAELLGWDFQNSVPPAAWRELALDGELAGAALELEDEDLMRAVAMLSRPVVPDVGRRAAEIGARVAARLLACRGAAAADVACCVLAVAEPSSVLDELSDAIATATEWALARAECGVGDFSSSSSSSLDEMDQLLEAWGLLVARRPRPVGGVFRRYCEVELSARRRVARASRLEDLDAELDPSEDTDEERYGLLAALGRADVGESARFLADCLGRRYGRGGDDEEALEDLCCVVEIATELLTDPFEPYYNEVPVELLRGGGESEVAALSELIFGLDDGDSPAAAASLAKFYRRWAATFLESDYMDGAYRNRPHLAAAVGRAAARWLERWPAEPKVAARALDVISAFATTSEARLLASLDLSPLSAAFLGWLEGTATTFVSRLLPDHRCELCRVLADCFLVADVLGLGGGDVSSFEVGIALPLSRVETNTYNNQVADLYAALARSGAAQAARGPNEENAARARRAPSETVVAAMVAGRIGSVPGTAVSAAIAARNLARAQLVYMPEHSRRAFFRALPSLVARALDEDDEDDVLGVVVETVDKVLADGALFDDDNQSALAALGAALPRVNATVLAQDLGTARRFYDAMGSLVALTETKFDPSFARAMVDALAFGTALPDGPTARAALRAIHNLARSDAAEPLLLCDALAAVLGPLLFSPTPVADRQDDAADAIFFLLKRLTINTRALADRLLGPSRADPAPRLAADLDALVAALPGNASRPSRWAFAPVFAAFLATAQGYLLFDGGF